MKKIYLFLLPLSICAVKQTFAQTAARSSVYAFLRQPASARISALAQSQISRFDDDASNGLNNPALLNAAMNNRLALNQAFLASDISTGFAGFVHHRAALKMTFSAGIQYANYGKFNLTDEFGNMQGTFKAGEYAVQLGAARQINERLSAGLNLKAISSQLEAYRSFGIAADLAGMYRNPEKNFEMSLVFKNFGAQISTYRPDNTEPMPTDVQLGISKKLSKAPFRFSVALHDLHRWQLRYDDPTAAETTLLGDEAKAPSKFSLITDEFFRHLRLGTEVVLGKSENFRVRFGYDNQIQRELRVADLGGLSGFSFGFGIKTGRFQLDYARNIQHLAGISNQIGLGIRFGKG